MCVYTCMCIIYVCIYVYIYICVYICVYIYVYQTWVQALECLGLSMLKHIFLSACACATFQVLVLVLVLNHWLFDKCLSSTFQALFKHKKTLGVPSSSAPVEWLFSIAGKVFSPERCQLTDKQLMFIRCDSY